MHYKSCISPFMYMYLRVHTHLPFIHQRIYFHRNTGALISVSLVSGWRGEKALQAILQPLMHWGYWAGKWGCIDFDLNWATFMVNFTRAASSAQQFTPSHLAAGKWDSFFTWGSTAVWRPHTGFLTLTWHDSVSSRRSLARTHAHTHDLIVWFLWRPVKVEILPFPHC